MDLPLNCSNRLYRRQFVAFVAVDFDAIGWTRLRDFVTRPGHWRGVEVDGDKLSPVCMDEPWSIMIRFVQYMCTLLIRLLLIVSFFVYRTRRLLCVLCVLAVFGLNASAR